MQTQDNGWLKRDRCEQNKEDTSELITCWDDIFKLAVPKNNVTHGTERRKSLC